MNIQNYQRFCCEQKDFGVFWLIESIWTIPGYPIFEDNSQIQTMSSNFRSPPTASGWERPRSLTTSTGSWKTSCPDAQTSTFCRLKPMGLRIAKYLSLYIYIYTVYIYILYIYILYIYTHYIYTHYIYHCHIYIHIWWYSPETWPKHGIYTLFLWSTCDDEIMKCVFPILDIFAACCILICDAISPSKDSEWHGQGLRQSPGIGQHQTCPGYWNSRWHFFGIVYGGRVILFFFRGRFCFFWVPGSLLLCFSAFPAFLLVYSAFLLFLLLCLSTSLLFCFSAFLLLCLSTSLLFCFCFSASLLVYFSAFLLLCFSAFCFSCFLLFLLLCPSCFSASLVYLLLFFSASLLFCFCLSTSTVLLFFL